MLPTKRSNPFWKAPKALFTRVLTSEGWTLMGALLLSLFLFTSSPIHATDVASGSASVTATVPASITSENPTAPILISPTNNTIINSNSPTFIFEPSSDSSGIHKYELWIDGNFDQDISPTIALTISATATSALADGLHTWKIKAVNNQGQDTDSATFSFTIDTTPPIILITNIAEHQTSLSSQDPTTIPANYSLTTTDLTPTISGSSESYATLTFSLTGSVANYTLTTIANLDSSFSLTPDFQLASDTYTVSIIGSDQALNSTSLPSFTLIITPQAAKTPAITVPLPSPFKDLTIPSLPIIPQLKLPALPKALTAFPLTPDSPLILTFLPWLIIFLLLLHILQKTERTIPSKSSGPIKPYRKLSLYITLILPTLILIYLALATCHWLPIFFIPILLWLIIRLKKANY